MRKTVSALKIRKNLGQLLEQVYYKRDEVIVERAGKEMAVLIPFEEYTRMMVEREKKFSVVNRVQKKLQGVSEKELDKVIGEATRAAKKNA